MKRSAQFEWTPSLEKELDDCRADCDPIAASSAFGPVLAHSHAAGSFPEFHVSCETIDIDKHEDMAVDRILLIPEERGGTVMPKWPQGDGDSAAGPCLPTDRANKDDTLGVEDVISESGHDPQDASMSPVVHCHGSESEKEASSPAKIDATDEEVASAIGSSESGHSSASYLTHKSHAAPEDHICPCCVSLGRCGACLRQIRAIRSSLKSPEGP